MENERRKIGIDIDDTLLDFVGTFIKYHNKLYKTNLKKEDFISYSFDKTIGGTMEESIKRVSEFYRTDFFKRILPLPNSVRTVNYLKQNYELFVVTSRPDYLQIETREQIMKHFTNSFSGIFYSSNHYTERKNSGKSKAEICLEKGISKLIDDSLEYALQCADKGLEVILLDSPWNQNGENNKIIRVKNWNEILEKLEVEK